jgi:hypothetical protein
MSKALGHNQELHSGSPLALLANIRLVCKNLTVANTPANFETLSVASKTVLYLRHLASYFEWDTLDPCYGHSSSEKQYHYHAVSLLWVIPYNFYGRNQYFIVVG